MKIEDSVEFGGKIVEKCTNIFIPNWYDKEDMELLVGEDLSDTDFQEICNILKEEGIADKVSELIIEILGVND
jgi:hypothetical protein